jgi:hypothetical protein
MNLKKLFLERMPYWLLFKMSIVGLREASTVKLTSRCGVAQSADIEQMTDVVIKAVIEFEYLL